MLVYLFLLAAHLVAEFCHSWGITGELLAAHSATEPTLCSHYRASQLQQLQRGPCCSDRNPTENWPNRLFERGSNCYCAAQQRTAAGVRGNSTHSWISVRNTHTLRGKSCKSKLVFSHTNTHLRHEIQCKCSVHSVERAAAAGLSAAATAAESAASAVLESCQRLAPWHASSSSLSEG